MAALRRAVRPDPLPRLPDRRAAARRGRERARPHAYTNAAQPDGLAGGDRALRDVSADGLPIGVQLAAQPWRDEVALAARWLSSARSAATSRHERVPPGRPQPPPLQTARWLARPIAFLESCRRRYGDTFSVMFQGFKTPLVMVSSPEVIRALYAERGHNLPPGRR